ncbi:MAG: NHLP bacteriocin system secretion protein [Gammaproteobacteria bacterium]|nr:NHLP bacteriocin system secretion protein [Gammaproteobacteria bacterium]
MSETDAKRDIFRREALEHLSSPEQLDALLEVTTSRAWLALATIGAGLGLALLWSVVGQIPITVEAVGILVYPRRIVSVQVPAVGQLTNLTVAVGDFVTKGQVLGTLNQPELAQTLEQERVRLAEALNEGSQKMGMLKRRLELEREALLRKRELLSARIPSLSAIAEGQKTRNDRYLQQQQANLGAARETQGRLGEALQKRFESYERLQREGLSSDDSVLSARQALMDNQVQRAELELKAQEIEVRRLDNEQAYQGALDRVDGYKSDLQELEIREKEFQQQELEASTGKEQQVLEIQRNIARLEQQLTSRGQIVSEYAGKVLELTAAPGAILAAGQRLGAIETEDEDAELMGLAYFAVEGGKQLTPGMSIRITPSTVQRERYGSIEGEVTEVSAFPVTTDAVTSMVGNAEVAQQMTQGQSVIQVLAKLFRDKDAATGFKWTSGHGPREAVTAGTTAAVRATIEYRRPITFLLPILRQWTGVG